MSNNSKPRKSKVFHDIEYKRRVVAEYLAGQITALDLAQREGLERGQIYKWKVQLDNRAREQRIETIAQDEGVSLEQARQIRELEEELEATQKKLAQTIVENELLKKLHQDYSHREKRSSGYIETKQFVARSKGRVK